ncbi:pancreatic triacylglycerol lipase-like [Eupeodes corollae]|uniref:pancreatic triacylglycerol lipase-like n=1 Tax=Eupeodes corollae TaxID=290404 RepID=UPI002491E6E0|nr:pancreatic triacylglycerol lipase-like [Eupeodes corollae]
MYVLISTRQRKMMVFKLFKNSLLHYLSLLLVLQGSMEFVVGKVAPNETTLIFYYGPQFEDSMRYELSDATEILKNPHFNAKGQIHLYLHGFKESQDSESVHIVVESYLKRKDINIITVDWAKAAGEQYVEAATKNIELLGVALSEVIMKLYNAGIDRKNLNVVAHSLGAQLAGKIGRNIILKSNGTDKIYRMAVLDAAFPLFFPGFLQTVNKNDAEFLQAIHTDIGTYGQPFTIGHVDFWPNGGRQGQPGCPQGIIIPLSKEDLCSHHRSWRFWAESVADVNDSSPKFLGFPSGTYLQFLAAGKGNLKNKPVEMGINCPMSARGNYYLKTNSQSPFARGMDGY